MKLKKRMQVVTAAVFCLFLYGFGIAHILLPDRNFSEVENRYLQTLPVFSWTGLKDGDYTADLETYLEDQFPLRDGWIGLKTRYEYLLGKREFGDESRGIVYLCGDKLISKVVESDRAQQNIDYLAQLVEKSPVPVYVAMTPTAAEIWRDQLPEGAASMDQWAYLEQVKDTGAIYVDVGGALAQHSGEALFYRTDHHWTSLGAYYAYAAFMEAMGLTPEPLGEKVTVSTDFNGTLYSTSGVHWLTPDEIDTYIPGDGVTVTVNDGTSETTHGLYVEENLVGKDKYTYFMGGNNPLYVIENPNAATDETLLVVRDSYADSLAPFLSQQYGTIYMMDLRYYRMGVTAFAESVGADAILVNYSVENFQKDNNVIFMGQ